MAKQKAASAPKIGMQRTFRWIWGILTLLSGGFILLGFVISGQAYDQTVGNSTDEMYKAGAALGATFSVGSFLCVAGPFFVLFLVLYWRNGVAITKARQHAEILDAMRGNDPFQGA